MGFSFMQQQEQQKLNGHKAADQAANGNELDEKEDFLQQIRTKVSSLNLFWVLAFP